MLIWQGRCHQFFQGFQGRLVTDGCNFGAGITISQGCQLFQVYIFQRLLGRVDFENLLEYNAKLFFRMQNRRRFFCLVPSEYQTPEIQTFDFLGHFCLLFKWSDHWISGPLEYRTFFTIKQTFFLDFRPLIKIWTVVYFDHQTHACMCVRIVENPDLEILHRSRSCGLMDKSVHG